MKTIIKVLMFLLSTSSLAGQSPQACMAACKAMGPEFKCELKYVDGLGAIMFVDRTTKNPSDKSKAFYLETRDCFLGSGGAIVELHDADGGNGHYMSCVRARTRSGIMCDRADNSESMRKLK